ncbi:prespore-specific protein [Tieghemostelium lacteum]|uniref:Prespore-specific protein n=1 Tax=Tieghemostelium lacteum TaxID=361077 RepID=A0A151Z6S5_TIELA|nr:prespore-specific protein [Tieghemostelium lacteum]|eukprot:KYQ89638.1 prespore-specific protein [Tieghemostelium lacteum]
MIKCKGNQHQRGSILFCYTCQQSICSACILPHQSTQHKLMDNEEVFDKILMEPKPFINNLNSQIDNYNQIKIVNQSVFQSEIKDHYNRQMTSIQSHFRDLHDQLHIREIEIKREINSHLEENTEQFSSFISNIDNEISKSNFILNEIQNPTTSHTNSKCSFISQYSNQIFHNISNNTENNYNYNNNNNNNNNNIIDYKIASFKESSSINNSILSIQLQLNRFCRNSKSKEKNIIYRYSSRVGVEKIDLETGKTSLIIDNTREYSPISGGRFLYQCNSNDSTICIFNRLNYWFLDCDSINPRWKIGNLPFDSYDLQSTIYDGKENIYLIGGFLKSGVDNNGETIKKMYKFNVKSELFTCIGELPIDCGLNGLSLDEDGNILIIGGFNYKHKFLNRIYRLNVSNNSLDVVFENTTLFGITLLRNGVYVPKHKSFYILTKDSKFFRLDRNGITYKLKSHSQSRDGFMERFYYDGDNFINLIGHTEKSISRYNIKLNSWSNISSMEKKSNVKKKYSGVDEETKKYQNELREQREYLKSTYRDRAKERRTGNADEENKRFEIVKKSENVDRDDTKDNNEISQDDKQKKVMVTDKPSKKTVECKSDMAKAIYQILSHKDYNTESFYYTKLQRQQNKELFQRGRTLYAFDLDPHFNQLLPSTITNSKDDSVVIKPTMTVRLDSVLLRKLSNYYSPGSQPCEEIQSGGNKDSRNSTSIYSSDEDDNVNIKSKVDEDSDNIYSDVEEYQCDMKPKDRKNSEVKSTKYFKSTSSDEESYDMSKEFKRNEEMDRKEEEDEDNYDIMPPENQDEEDEDNYDIMPPNEDEEDGSYMNDDGDNGQPIKKVLYGVDSVIKSSLKDKNILKMDTSNENLKRKLEEIESDEYLPKQFEFKGFERERGEKTKDLENLMKSVQDDKEYEKSKKLKSDSTDTHKSDIKLHKQMQQINQIFKKKAEETGEKFVNIFGSDSKHSKPKPKPTKPLAGKR